MASRRRCSTRRYVITGGLGGFGLELADWLITKGARKLVLTSRSGVRSGYQRMRVGDFRKRGADVRVSTHNVAIADQAEQLFRESAESSTVGGVFHLAMVLKDAFFANQQLDSFREVVAAKLEGGRHLDRLSRRYCDGLESLRAQLGSAT